MNGNVYAIGDTISFNFPSVQALDSSLSGEQDCMFYKLNTDGRVAFSSYLGGSDAETGNSVAIDGYGALYLAGGTKSDNLQTNNALDDSHNSGWDCYVLKLNTSSASSVSLGSLQIVAVAGMGLTVVFIAVIIYWFRIKKPTSPQKPLIPSGPPPEIE